MSDIRIITEPSVRLVGRQSIDEEALADFLQDEGVESWETDTDIAGQKLVEVAGRLCYKSYAKPRPGGNAAYLGHILEVGHGSVIEHAVYSFIITGVSRSFTHELVRHRAGWAYSQRSQRFCDESDLSVVVPSALKDEIDAAMAWLKDSRWADDADEALELISHSGSRDIERMGLNEAVEIGLRWLAAMEYSRNVYGYMADYLANRNSGNLDRTTARKKAREAARSVLPNATETQIFVTANARSLRNFLEQRGSREADAEIRRVAVAICNIMKREAPELFADFLIVGDKNSVTYITNSYKKV